MVLPRFAVPAQRPAPLTSFVARRPRLSAALVAGPQLAIGYLSRLGAAPLPWPHLAATTGALIGLICLPIGYALALVWLILAFRARRAVPRELRLGAYGRSPAFVAATTPPPQWAFSLLLGMNSLVSGLTSPWPAFRLAFLAGAAAFLAIIVLSWPQVPFLRLTPAGVVARRVWRSRTIPWDALYPGHWPTYEDRNGRIWLLVDGTVPRRRFQENAAPPHVVGYRWVHAANLAVVDPAWFAATVLHYRIAVEDRPTIGTAAGLAALPAVRAPSGAGGARAA